jgi:hypothetical protein
MLARRRRRRSPKKGEAPATRRRLKKLKGARQLGASLRQARCAHGPRSSGLDIVAFPRAPYCMGRGMLSFSFFLFLFFFFFSLFFHHGLFSSRHN